MDRLRHGIRPLLLAAAFGALLYVACAQVLGFVTAPAIVGSGLLKGALMALAIEVVMRRFSAPAASLASLADFLAGGAGRWSCPLPWGGSVELAEGPR